MGQSYKKLEQGIFSGAGIQDTLYAAPPNTEVIIKHIRLVNYSGADETAKLWNGGIADSNLILPSATIVSGGWAEFDGVITIQNEDTIKGEASSGSAVAYTIYGVEIT